MKHLHKLGFVTLWALLLLAAVALTACGATNDHQNPEDSAGTTAPVSDGSSGNTNRDEAGAGSGDSASPTAPGDDEDSITLAIHGPEEVGAILQPTRIALEEEDTPFSVLNRVCREQKIHMSHSGRGKNIQIDDIDNLFAGDEGAMSGWMFSVNGEFPMENCGAITLAPGDVVDWYYTLDMGKDIGVQWMED